MNTSGRPLVRVLGDPGVVVDEEDVVFDTRKALAILAFLAVEGKASRDALAGLFWPDSSQERARATLRRTLSAIRSGAGPDAITADRHQVAWGHLDSDLARFDRSLDEAGTHRHTESEVCGRCVEPLHSATDLYRADFMSGFGLKEAPAYEDWERQVRETLRRRVGAAFDRLATAHTHAGDHRKAIEALNRWIELDPLHEPAHRRLMLSHAWQGDRPGAIDAYRAFAAALDRDLAVTPLEETTELYEAILDNDLPPAPSRIADAEAVDDGHHATEDRLLGRVVESQRLNALLHASNLGGAVVALTGPAWMGKTRLLEDLSRSATGHLVLAGRAHRAETNLPYALVAQLLDAVDPSLIDPRPPRWIVDEVARIAPRFGDGRSESIEPFGEIRLLEAMKELIWHLAERAPVLLTVDDLQWIDHASAKVLSFLSSRLSSHRVLLAMALRTGERLDSEVASMVSDIEHIALLPLEAGELDCDPATAHETIRLTGGVPILVAEHLDGGDVSNAVEKYILDRLVGLSALARQVLEAASALASACTHRALREVSGRSEEELVDALDELGGARLLTEHSDSDRYGFTLDAASEMIYQELSLARRRLLHRRAAEALARRSDSTTDARVAALVATHFEKAGDPSAARWFVTAADLARRAYANQEAQGLYQTAVALGGDNKGDLHLALGELALVMGSYDEAVKALNIAAAVSEGTLTGRIEHRLGEVHRILGRFDRAQAYYERAASIHEYPALVLADWALLVHRIGDAQRAVELGHRALGSLGPEAQPSIASKVHNVLGAVTSEPDVARTHLDEAIELAGNDDVAMMTALNNKSRLLADQDDVDGALGLAIRAIDLAAKTGHRHREASLRDHLADLHHRRGDTVDAQRAQTEALTMLAGIDLGTLEPELWRLHRW